jgi:hypothetical protein
MYLYTWEVDKRQKDRRDGRAARGIDKVVQLWSTIIMVMPLPQQLSRFRKLRDIYSLYVDGVGFVGSSRMGVCF